MKITQKIEQAKKEKRTWWSFEYFPPRTAQVRQFSVTFRIFYQRLRTGSAKPRRSYRTYATPRPGVHRRYMVCSSTWPVCTQTSCSRFLRHSGGRTSELTTEMIKFCQGTIGLETCMHLTCTNMQPEKIDIALAVRP